MKPTEQQIQSSIIEYLTLKKYKVIRMNAGNNFKEYKGKTYMIRGMEAGMPDLMAFKDLYPIPRLALYFFEVKRPGKQPTEIQMLKMIELRDYGAQVHCVHSLEEVQALGI